MRICLISREFAPFYGSGVGVYAAEAARAWRDAGHEVHIITGDHAGVIDQGRTLFPGIVFHPVDMQDGPASELPEPLGAAQWPLAAYDRLWRLHERGHFEYAEFPDFAGEGHFVIQGRRLLPGRPEGLPGCVLGVRLHMPALLIDQMNRRTWRGRLRAYLAEMERGVIDGADIVWAPCRAVVEAVRASGVEVRDTPDRPVIVSPNPFTPPDSGGVHAGVPAHPASESIVFVGRLERRKGPDVLIRAAIDLVRTRPNLHLRLIGGDTDTGPLDSSVTDWLRCMIPADCRDRITLDGQKPRPECIDAVRAATVVCFPALWDNWPYAVLEAMAAGACIVASDSGGHAEMLRHDHTALLAPAGDPPALAAQLRRALDDAPLRTRLGAAARDAAIRLGDPAAFARQTIDHIKQVATRRPGRAPSAPAPSPSARAVTVVIPHKDMPDYLPDALGSLAAQTLRSFEVILVDDRSEHPRAVELIDRLERDGPPAGAPFALRILRTAGGASRGPAAARNAGIAAATTPLVVLLDADDTLAPTHLEKSVAAMAANPDLACLGALVAYFTESPDRSHGSWAPLGLVRDMLPAMNTMGTGSGITLRRAALAALPAPWGAPSGPFDPVVPGYEDWDLYCALAAAGCTAAILPELLINYRVREDSRYHGQDRLRHDRLAAELATRHPTLAEHPDVAMRLIMAESRARQLPLKRRLRRLRRERRAHQREARQLRAKVVSLEARVAALKARLSRARTRSLAPDDGPATTPLRYRAADRAAGLLRRAGLSGPARRILRRLRRSQN